MIYLIDFENVHEEGFSALGRLGDKDAVYCFFTRNVAKISMSALAGMRSGQLHFIEAESGKQSLDLALVSFLGYLIGTRPQELYYDIVSNDNGFAKVAEFWNKRATGLRVRIRKTTDLKPKAEPVKPQPAANSQRRAQVQKTVAEQPAPAAEPAEPAPAQTVTEEPAAKTEQAPAAAVEAKQESGRSAQNRTRGRQRAQRQRGTRQEQQANASAAAAPTPEAVTDPAAEAAPAAEAVPVQVTPVPAKKASEEKSAEPAPAEKQAEKTAEAKSAPKQAEAKASESAKPKAEAKPLDAATAAALEAAGINAAATEFIQAQAEKYRSDKNMKQLVYRAVVKKYGQKVGTQIYNSAKKLLLK